MQKAQRLHCDPMEHLLVINLEGDRGKSRRDHVTWRLTYGARKASSPCFSFDFLQYFCLFSHMFHRFQAVERPFDR